MQKVLKSRQIYGEIVSRRCLGGVVVSDFEVGGSCLARVHRIENDRKWYCYFTGFLEGIAASGQLEVGEVEPLLAQCREFFSNIGDPDASDFIEDCQLDLLTHEQVLLTAEVRSRNIDVACQKSAKNRFNGFCAGISCDGSITLSEVETAIGAISRNPELLNDPDVRGLNQICVDAIADGIVDEEEQLAICDAINQIIGDIYSDTGLSSLGATRALEYERFELILENLEGACIVLTGNFEVSPRRILEEKLSGMGAIIGRTVSKKVHYVLVADEASRDWIETHQGHKIKKAMELKLKYGAPSFLTEKEVVRHLGLNN